MGYQDYTVRHFLLDDSFRKWVMNPDPEIIAYWESWLKKNPDQSGAVAQAREVLLLIRFREYHPAANDQAEIWEKIEKTIGEDEILHFNEAERKIISMPLAVKGDAARPSGVVRRTAVSVGRTTGGSRRIAGGARRKQLRYAALLTGFLVAVSITFYLYNKTPVRHRTAYGEVKTIVLPDNSIIKLNAHSSLRYSRNWDKERPREIWLNGEAFFSVVHKSNDQQFLVHTDDVTVQVRGTEFNVNSRHIATKVVLNNGSVRLVLNSGDKSEGAGDLLMQPGDMVSWSSRTGKLATKKVDPELYSSWRTNILTFKDTPITEVARSLRDNFGLIIRFEGKGIRQETFTGTIPMDNVEIFFKTLSRTFDVEIIKKDGEIFIVKK